MKLGLAIGYSGAEMSVPVELVKLAEDLGFDSVWTAEAYGSDATSPLAYLAAVTDRIRLGTSVMQLAGRPPAMAAMQAATIDALAGGDRFIAGLGVSGPQIVEGWYGQPWGKPYWRIRDYVSIMRKVLAREEPVTHDGREISLPYAGEGALGIGKPLKSILHMNPRIPIWLGTGGEANVRLTAEIADGWFPLAFVPGMMDHYLPWLEQGLARAGGGKTLVRPRDPGPGVGGRDRRCRRRAAATQAGHRALCRRYGPPRHELPQRHDGQARLPGSRSEDPGAVPLGQQA